MEKTGLAKRLALQCLKLTGGSFNGLVAGFFLAGLVLVVILPSILARVVIFCAIAVGIIQALQLDAKSRMSSTIIMMAFFAAQGDGQDRQLLGLCLSGNIHQFDILRFVHGNGLHREGARNACFRGVLLHVHRAKPP